MNEEEYSTLVEVPQPLVSHLPVTLTACVPAVKIAGPTGRGTQGLNGVIPGALIGLLPRLHPHRSELPIPAPAPEPVT
jgi:hypothetical protein